MGMYNSLFVKCPECGNNLEFQSKSGPCSLINCNKSNLPIEIALGMNGDVIRCQFCCKRIKLVCKIPIKVKIDLIVTKGLKFDYEGNYNPKHPYSKIKEKKLREVLNIKENKSVTEEGK